MAITYDKIAGDFERQNILDSAIIYYSKAIKAGLSCDLNSKKEKRMLSQFYNNRGNFYLMNKTRDIAKARSNLYEAIKINKSIELFDFWLIFDLCRLNIEYEGFINLSKAREHLNELKSKSASIQFITSQIFQLKYLEFDLLVKENYITKSLSLLKEVFASYNIAASNGNGGAVSGILTLSAGDEITMRLYHNEGGTEGLQAGRYCTVFSGYKLIGI